MERYRGPAGDVVGGTWPLRAVPAVRVVEVSGPALVLGSTQPEGVVDAGAAAAAGVTVTRRRSGGGAVLVVPGELVWVDVFVPHADRQWVTDVGRAFYWLGRSWVRSLEAVGVAASWHDGPVVASRWSSLVCFAGLGPGEVRAAGAKVVGISARRSRAGALFQCAALMRWDPAGTLALLALDDEERSAAAGELATVAAGLEVAGHEVAASLLDRLARD